MITNTESDAFRAIVADNKLLAVALFDLIDAIVVRHINRRPPGDAIAALEFLREQIEKGPGK